MQPNAVPKNILPRVNRLNATLEQHREAGPRKQVVERRLGSEMGTEPSIALEESERVELQECEKIIERGLATFYEVGTALFTIRKSCLYRLTHSSFRRKHGLGLIFLLGHMVVCAGCVWHGARADIIYGPAFVKNGGLNGNLVQAIQFPVVLEGGGQWGITAGVLQRQTMSAAYEINQPASGSGQDRWCFRWFYRVPQGHRPEFVRRVFDGAQLQIGGEATAFSVGAGDKTTLHYSDNHLYQLKFDSARPSQASLLLDPSVESILTNVPNTNLRNKL
jgi:hypothetical protein